MADDWAIKVEGLGKRYTIAANGGGYTALRDVLSQGVRRAARRVTGRGGGAPVREPFWALRDVSFEVPRGECVGVIGRNGAGKSTLLKILSRITEPTEGEVQLRGRVGSLLEVGTGFHPELTGRENVFLNGAILGMTRREISRKFGEIAEFAEVEKFLDTPVKHYSSGMYTRLAFAVAAHLEPEILIVDEVLAVGDAEFQKKCLGKMGEVAKGGRTVIFVSHNMSAVQGLCSHAVLLEKGLVTRFETTSTVLAEYLNNYPSNTIYVSECSIRPVSLERAEVRFSNDLKNEELRLTVWIRSSLATSLAVDVLLADPLGVPVAYGSLGAFDQAQMISINSGLNRAELKLDIRGLAVGSYQISIDLTRPHAGYHHRVEACLTFECPTPKTKLGETRLMQAWGKGCWELPTEAVGMTAIDNAVVTDQKWIKQ